MPSAINGGDWAERRPTPSCPNSRPLPSHSNPTSQPAVSTQYGWQHRQLLGDRDFDNTADAARERAFETLRDSAWKKATELWLQKIRDESY